MDYGIVLIQLLFIYFSLYLQAFKPVGFNSGSDGKNSRIWLDFAFLPSCYVVFVFSSRCFNRSDSLTLSEHPDSHVSHAWGKKHVLCFQGNLIRIVGFELDFHSTRSRSCKQPTLHVLKGHSSPCESDCLSFPTYHSCSLYR